MNDDGLFSEYTAFIEETDRKVAEQYGLHKDHVLCKAGCSSCCEKFSVLKIERDFIYSRMKGSPALKPANENNEACSFLHEGLCTIYAVRPLICRTHGLALLYAGEEGESAELSFCDLNFTDLADGELEEYFSPVNILDMDEINSKLAVLNAAYVKALGAREIARQRLADLHEELYGKSAQA